MWQCQKNQQYTGSCQTFKCLSTNSLMSMLHEVIFYVHHLWNILVSIDNIKEVCFFIFIYSMMIKYGMKHDES